MKITLFTSESGRRRMLANAGFMGVTEQDIYFPHKFTVNKEDAEQSFDDKDMYWIEKSDSVELD